MIVSANKPAFFKGGTQLREVDMRTGYLHIGKEPKELLPGRVYSGGSIELFEKLTGARGDKVRVFIHGLLRIRTSLKSFWF